jgi:hypothetical protein
VWITIKGLPTPFVHSSFLLSCIKALRYGVPHFFCWQVLILAKTKESRSCREHTPMYMDAVVCCATCSLWNGKKCDDEARVKMVHERKFEELDREMRSNRAVFLE